MIYITGDVHSKIRNYFEQKIAGSELKAAIIFLKILRKYKLSSTLFVNGKCLDENPEEVKNLLEFDVELGGHTYNNFGNLGIIRKYLNKKIYGCIYGSAFYQRKDVKKTKRAFEKLGLEMKSWRTHAFGSNKKTLRILRQNEVKYVSDLLGETKPFVESGIIHMPVNIPVDQNSIAYSILRPENRNPFIGCKEARIKPEEWFEILKKRVEKNEKDKVPSIILIHPITMAVLDNFRLFEKIARFLSKYKSGKISELIIK